MWGKEKLLETSGEHQVLTDFRRQYYGGKSNWRTIMTMAASTFVPNDTVPNFLFRNNGDGGFTEIGMRAGVALSDDGVALSSMGADFRDIDNDGWPDIFLTALPNETFPLFIHGGGSLPERLGIPDASLGRVRRRSRLVRMSWITKNSSAVAGRSSRTACL